MKTQAIRSISDVPDVKIIEKFLTAPQCRDLLQLVKKSDSDTLFSRDNPAIHKIYQAVAKLLSVPVENLESLSIHCCRRVDQSEPSPQFLKPEPADAIADGSRTTTVLLALNNTEAGGETIFPSANLTITLLQGSALIIRNLLGDGSQDPEALPGFLPVTGGEKWIGIVHARESLELKAAKKTSECPFSNSSSSEASAQRTESLPLAAAEQFAHGSGGLIRVWRLHPEGAQIVAADKTLMGDAPTGAVRWCGPFTHANAYGFWLYPPLDIDITWHGGRSFEYEIINGYSDADYEHMHSLQAPEDSYQYDPREKVEAGSVFEGIFSIWTGCAFQTPPGWALMVRSVINKPVSPVFKVQEGILETDWLPYDIWMNLQFVQQNKKVSLRRNNIASPVAQIVPVPRQAYDRPWELTESMMERSTPEGEAFYQSWLAYNYKKWVKNDRKEPSTYNTERARHFKDERQGQE